MERTYLSRQTRTLTHHDHRFCMCNGSVKTSPLGSTYIREYTYFKNNGEKNLDPRKHFIHDICLKEFIHNHNYFGTLERWLTQLRRHIPSFPFRSYLTFSPSTLPRRTFVALNAAPRTIDTSQHIMTRSQPTTKTKIHWLRQCQRRKQKSSLPQSVTRPVA
jgi:hypothetical protein